MFLLQTYLYILFLVIVLLSTPAYAGTGTGCSGDQWDDYPADVSHWVYHTNKSWEIGTRDYEGCGTVSARNASDVEVSMSNKICKFIFKAETGLLTIKNVGKKHCFCHGLFALHKVCSKVE